MTINLKSTCGVIAVSLFLAGCAGAAIHKTSKLGATDVLSLDARQRVIINQAGITCAEPSPDAIAAQAAALAAAAEVPNSAGSAAAGRLAASSSESVASIAQRTQAIQLMRDGYYRICEAYANKAISPSEYKKVVQGIDEFMIALIGIEAIGGSKNVPAVAIGTQGTASVNKEDVSANSATGNPGITIESLTDNRKAMSDEQAQSIRRIVEIYLRKKRSLRPADHSYYRHSRKKWKGYQPNG